MNAQDREAVSRAPSLCGELQVEVVELEHQLLGLDVYLDAAAATAHAVKLRHQQRSTRGEAVVVVVVGVVGEVVVVVVVGEVGCGCGCGCGW